MRAADGLFVSRYLKTPARRRLHPDGFITDVRKSHGSLTPTLGKKERGEQAVAFGKTNCFTAIYGTTAVAGAATGAACSHVDT